MPSLSDNSLTITVSLKDNASAGASKLNSVVKSLGDQTEESGAKAEDSGNHWLKMGTVMGVVAGMAQNVTSRAIDMVTSSIGDAVKRVDTLNNAPRVLENLGYSATDSKNAITDLDKGVRGLPTSLDAAASALTSIASASGLGIGDATKLTLAFNDMALAGGKGPAAAQQALEQFTQALGKGQFQMQDYRTLLDVMPAQLNQVAKTLLGPTSNAQQLGTALTTGQVSMDDFTKTVMDLDTTGGAGFASFHAQAKTATDGIGTGISNMETAVVRGVGDVIKAIGSKNISDAVKSVGSVLEGMLSGVADGIKFVDQHKDVFKTIAAGVAGLAAALAIMHFLTVASELGAVFKVASLGAGALSQLEVNTKSAAVAQWLLNAAMNANPITVAILAIAALVAALGWFFTQTKLGQQIVTDVWAGIVAVWNAAPGWFAGIGKGAVDGVTGAFHSVVGFFAGIASGMVNAFSGVGSRIAGFFKGIWDGIGKDLKDAINSVLHLPLTIPKIDIPHVGSIGGQTLIPKLATGTGYAPGGLTLVGEYGPELLNIPRGASVTTAAQTKETARKSGSSVSIGNVTINNNMDEEKFLRDLGWRLSIA